MRFVQFLFFRHALGQLVLPAVFSFDNIGNILTFMNSGAIIHLGNIVPK